MTNAPRLGPTPVLEMAIGRIEVEPLGARGDAAGTYDTCVTVKLGSLHLVTFANLTGSQLSDKAFLRELVRAGISDFLWDTACLAQQVPQHGWDRVLMARPWRVAVDRRGRIVDCSPLTLSDAVGTVGTIRSVITSARFESMFLQCAMALESREDKYVSEFRDEHALFAAGVH